MAAKLRQAAIGSGERAGGVLVWGPMAHPLTALSFGAIHIVVVALVRIFGSRTEAMAAGLPMSSVVAVPMRAAATLPIVPLTWFGGR